jgi:hypothetical protein
MHGELGKSFAKIARELGISMQAACGLWRRQQKSNSIEDESPRESSCGRRIGGTSETLQPDAFTEPQTTWDRFAYCALPV